ncbi:MAG: glycosyltransferase family 4 protein [Chitinophagaceae bacterium]|nr:glycosyltransferase family 4 protein [Chitinophagaceae bacterium]
MKILYFYQYFSTPKGSWGTRVYEFAGEWVKQGHEVTVVTSVYAKSDIQAKGLLDTQYFDGIQVKIINVTIDNRQGFLKRIWSFIQYALLSSWYALTLSADVVIASSGPITVGLPGLLARYLRKRPLVFETRDLWPDGAIELGILKNKWMIRGAKAFERRCYKASSLIVALSSGMKKHIQLHHAHPNVIDVTNAANIELFATPKAFDGRGVLQQKKYAIYTGNIGAVNNSWWLLHAAHELSKQGRDDIHVVLIGEGQQREALEAEAATLHLKNFIRWGLMPKEELVSFVQHALVSLVPLKGTPVLDTSSPNKFFESLAAGVPVIQNTQGWMKTFLEEHRIGYTVDPNNPKALADVLIELSNQPTEWQEMGERAKHIAAKEFDKTFLANKMLDALKGVVQTNKKRV